LKSVIERGAAATNLLMLSEFQARNDAALQALINEHNVKLRKYPDDVLNKIGGRAGEVLQEIASRDALSTEVFGEIVKFRRTALRWTNTSESAYAKARALPFKYPG
jgi:TRAP-type mannitol/chloroaromatic compound transport system substrate-binding protein